MIGRNSLPDLVVLVPAVWLAQDILSRGGELLAITITILGYCMLVEGQLNPQHNLFRGCRALPILLVEWTLRCAPVTGVSHC